MAAPARLAVAAACPACAAPLDFVEGASCARCGHCGTRLLLPGRRHVLTYHVIPQCDAARSLVTARAASPGAHRPTLSFLPYYRFTADELRWQWPMRPGPTGLEPDCAADPELAERAVARTFLGCRWDGLDLYSIGARAAALRLALFRPDALPDGARVVVPQMSAAAAIAHALRLVDRGVAQRALVCQMLGLVYFPFWIVPLGTAERCRFAVVDGVTGRLATADGPPPLLEALVDPPAREAVALGLRPLLCPNCGWDLPDDPDQVLFVCSRCTRVWELRDERLAPLAAAVVPPPAGSGSTVQHLPMWIVDAADAPPLLRRIVVPAFRHRVLRLQLVLAAQMTRRRLELPSAEGAPAAPSGGYFNRDDALALARFVAAGIDREAAARLDLAPPRLVWWPFERLPGSVREPVTRFALQAPRPGLKAPAAPIAATGRSGS